jgi:hypothetical protein
MATFLNREPFARIKAISERAGPRRLAVWALVVLALLYAGWLAYVITADRPLDFYVYYMAAETFARGGSAYSISDAEWDALAADLGITNYTRPYRYPPHIAALLTLFRPLGPHGAMVVWVIANAAAMVAGAWLLGRALGGRWVPVSLAGLGLFVPPLATLLAGQVNGLLFISLAWALWGLVRRRDAALGLGLALGAALKVIPLALVLYLFWRRRWRAGLVAVGALVILTLACVPVVGWQGLADYAQSAVFLGRPDTVYATPTNQTFTAVLGRAFPAASDTALSGGRWLGLLMVIATAFLCWPTGNAARTMPLEFGLIVVALQLIPPFTWYHQLVLLLLPMMIVAERLWAERRWSGLGGLVALFCLTDLHGLGWHYVEKWPWATSFPFLLGIALWGLAAWLLVREKRHVPA